LSDERPKAPWHPFPLVELCVLVGIVLIVLGLIVGFDSDRGQLALVCGVLLASLGGLDTAVREHFAGYRSHTFVLAGFPAVALAVILAVAGLPPYVPPAVAVIVFVAASLALRRAWHRKAAS
jgi:hypothetical protein